MFRVVSEDEFEGSRKGGLSDEELLEPYSDKRWAEKVSSREECSGKIMDGVKGYQ